MLNLDVVICVHNALEHVQACLDSVEVALHGRGRLILVDDASDAPTRELLDTRTAALGATLIRHEERQGYTRSANDGVRASTGRNVLLLNSDTIVPPKALDRLARALDLHPRLGVVGPLSNAASLQSVPSVQGTATQTAINPLPAGVTPADLDALFARRRWNALTRTPLVHGFCLAVKRKVFDRIGLFDEATFPDGFGEENDFCLRAADAGFDLGVLTSTYVYHVKSASYTHDRRAPLAAAAQDRLEAKHGADRVNAAIEEFARNPGLARAREVAAEFYAARSSGA